MSEIRKEFVFSARDTGVADTAARVKQSVSEIGQDLIRDAVANTNTAKEAVKYYEEQVRLIEQRNRLDREQATLSSKDILSRDLGTAKTDDQRLQAQSQHKARLGELGQEAKEDKLQVDLLRELIDTIKSTSREDVEHKERLSFNEMSQEQRMASLGGDAAGALGRAHYTERNPTKGENPDSSTESTRSSSGNIAQRMGNLAQAQDIGGVSGEGLSMMSQAGKAGGYAALAYGTYKVGEALFAAEEKSELRMRELAALTGSSTQALSRANIGSTKMGQYGATDLNVDLDEMMTQHIPAMARGRGSSDGILKRTLEGLEVQKGMAISPSLISMMENMARTTSGVSGSADIAQSVYKAMVDTGALGSGSDMSRMQSMIQTLVSYQQESLTRTGSPISMDASLGLMSQFESLGGVYKDDQYKMSTIQNLSRGMASSSSPAVQAMKMQMLRSLNPEKGFFDLQIEQEKGIESEGFLEKMMGFVKSSGMSEDQQMIVMNEMTGGTMRKADISRMIKSGKFDDGISGDFSAKDFNFKERALDASSRKAAVSIWSKETVEEFKGEIVTGLEKIVEAITIQTRTLNDM